MTAACRMVGLRVDGGNHYGAAAAGQRPNGTLIDSVKG